MRALVDDLREARWRTLRLVAGLSDAELLGPLLPILNPGLWELGHVAWFQEKWILRHCRGRPPIRAEADSLWDSARIPHDARWDLPLPSRADTLAYMEEVLEEVAVDPREEEAYFFRLALFHEDMHAEALVYTRQTLGYPPPPCAHVPPHGGGPLPGDVEIPGAVFHLGARDTGEFVFDNEKWAHPVKVEPFRIARAPVTQAEFASFVDAGGYLRPEHWSAEGRAWRERAAATHPVYWQRGADGRWWRRHYDRLLPLEPHLPMLFVNAYEAEAWCRWAGRRLPAEAEWELAAGGPEKRRWPWGETPPDDGRAHLGLRMDGPVEVGAFAVGETPEGVRQMAGNVWEWTASTFRPYPGFVADPYREYSQPWFGTHRVLRGGCFATQPRLLRNTWRNFYTPDRRDVLAGFRTVAILPDGVAHD